MAINETKSGQPKRDFHSGFFDTSIILALCTAVLYSSYYLYLFGFYQRCGVSLVDLHYSIQDALAFSPGMIFFALFFSAIIAYQWLSDPPKERIGFYSFKLQWQKVFPIFLLMLALLIGTCFYWQGRMHADQWLQSKTHGVIITTDNKIITDYSYLCRSSDLYYFFKMNDSGGSPEILVLEISQVKELLFKHS